MLELAESILKRREELRYFFENGSRNDLKVYGLRVKEYYDTQKVENLVNSIKELEEDIEALSNLMIETKIVEEKKEIEEEKATKGKEKEELLKQLEGLFEGNKPLNQDSQTEEDKRLVDTNRNHRSKPDFEAKISKIQGKSWESIKHSLSSLLSPIIDPGNPPEETIVDFPEFDSMVEEIVKVEEATLHEEKTPKYQHYYKASQRMADVTFRSGLFLLHKASHIIGASEEHADKGINTWSLAQAYQGSLICVHAILKCLGIEVIAYKGMSFIVNCWPSKTNNEVVDDGEIKISILRFDHKIEHRHTWDLFKRILSSYRIETWDDDLVKLIISMENGHFGFQRNYINYWGGGWIYSDLHDYENIDDFGKKINEYTKLEDRELKSDFTISFAQLLLNMAVEIITDVGIKTNAVKLELDMLLKFLNSPERHPLFNSNFSK